MSKNPENVKFVPPCNESVNSTNVHYDVACLFYDKFHLYKQI